MTTCAESSGGCGLSQGPQKFEDKDLRDQMRALKEVCSQNYTLVSALQQEINTLNKHRHVDADQKLVTPVARPTYIDTSGPWQLR